MEFSGYLEVRTVSLVHITYVENFGGGERDREREGGEGMAILFIFIIIIYFGCYENKRKQREVGIAPPPLFSCLVVYVN